DGGTLFLDEIGDMDVAIQAKLLKVLEGHRYRRVGDTRERQADVRVLVATHHHLLDRVHEGRFRADLFYRVSLLPLHLPALRERAGDLPVLARRILGSLGSDAGREAPMLTADAERALAAHAWPGNLRELRNVLERALLACDGGAVERRHLGLEPGHEAGHAAPGRAGGHARRPGAHVHRARVARGAPARRARGRAARHPAQHVLPEAALARHPYAARARAGAGPAEERVAAPNARARAARSARRRTS